MSSFELAQLDGRHDLKGLRSALDALCSRYGSLLHLTILPANHVGRQQALCFMRMANVEQEQRLMTALGIGRFGGELVLVVNLRPDRPAYADAGARVATPQPAPINAFAPHVPTGGAAAGGPAH